MEQLEKTADVDNFTTSDYAERIDFLESSGALDHLSELRKESRELDSLINDAAGLFALSEIEEMIAFSTSRLLDRFIPTRLVFIIERNDELGIETHCFKNMKPDGEAFPVQYMRHFREYFKASPYAAPFSALEDALGAEQFGRDLRAYEPAIVFPMLGIGGLFGVMLLGTKLVGNEYSNLERMYADRLLRFLSICIQNRLHRERSITDPKTGLYNHPYFMRRLEEEAARAARRKTSCGLVMIDIDHFKIFNDTWGHLAGDEVLQGIGRLLKGSIRAEDVASRFGGEEFCLLLVDCDEDKLFDVSERIRREIEAMRIRFKNDDLEVTASLGCCPLDVSWRGEAKTFVERADKALYRSKAAGRNRTTVYRFGLLGRASALRSP